MFGQWIDKVEESVSGLPFRTRIHVVSVSLVWLPKRGTDFRKAFFDELKTRAASADNKDVGGGLDDARISRAAVAIGVLESINAPKEDPQNGRGLPTFLDGVIESLFIPLFANDSTSSSQQATEICSILCNLLAKGGYFNALANLLEKCCVALESYTPASLLLCQLLDKGESHQEHDTLNETWNFRAVCLLMPHLMHAIRYACSIDTDVGNVVEGFVKKSLPMVLKLAQAENAETRKAALDMLLPPVIGGAITTGKELACTCMQSVWHTCQKMINGDGHQRSSAFGALVRFIDRLGISGNDKDALLDLRSEDRFWESVKIGLSDDDSLTQKRARFVLEAAWEKEGAMTDWKSHFLALYDLLDEFALYFVKAKWHLVDELHSPKINEGQGSGDSRTEESGACLEFSWMQIIWQKAFSHKNHQIQRLAVRSFLERDWSGDLMKGIHMGFVLDCLLPALGNPALHNDPSKFDVQGNAESFLFEFADSLDEQDQIELMRRVLERVETSDLSRLAFQSLIGCFESIAKGIAGAAVPKETADMMIAMTQPICAFICNYHGASYKLQMYGKILGSISMSITPPNLTLSTVCNTLIELPRYLLLPTGSLHAAVSGWLCGNDQSQKWFADEIHREVELFFGVMDKERNESDEDVFGDMVSWEAQACLLSLMFALWKGGNQSRQREVNMLGRHIEAIYTRPYLPHGTAPKALLLLRELLKVSIVKENALGDDLAPDITSMLSVSYESLASYASNSILVLLTFEDGSQQGTKGRNKGGSLLPAKLWFGCEKAVLAVECVMGSMQMLIESHCCGNGQHVQAVSALLGVMSDVMEKLLAKREDMVHIDKDAELHRYSMKILGCICQGLVSTYRAIDDTSLFEKLWGNESRNCHLKTILEFCMITSKSGSMRLNLGQEFEVARWKCVDAAFGLSDTGMCTDLSTQTSIKVSVLKSLLDSFEYAEDQMIVLLLRSTRPILKELINDSSFLMEASKTLKGNQEGDEQNVLSEVVGSIAHAIWASFADVKKQALECAAFVNTVFLEELFLCEDSTSPLWSLHTEDGPIHWLVNQLVGFGARSPRVMLMTTLQLTRTLLRCPNLIELYLPCIKECILYGTIDKGYTEHEGDVQSLDYVQSAEMQCLSALSDSDLLNAYAASQFAPRVAVVCFIYKLAIHAGLAMDDRTHGSQESGKELAKQAEAAGKKIWDYLLDIALNGPQQSTVQYKIGSITHRLKMRLWQALCVSSHFVYEPEDIKAAIPKLKSVMKRGNVSSVRMFVETTMTALLLKMPNLMVEMVLPILREYSKRHEALPCYILIAIQVALNSDKTFQEEQIPVLVNSILPWTMSHNHSTRAFAQLAIQTLLERRQEASKQLSDLEATSDPAIAQALSTFFVENPDMLRLKRTLGSGIYSFGRKEIATPRSVFVSGANLAGSNEEEIPLEAAPESLLDQLINFLTRQRAKVRKSNTDRIVAKEAGSSELDDRNGKTSGGRASTLSSDFQRKITPMDRAVLVQGTEGLESWTLGAMGLVECVNSGGVKDYEDLVRSAWSSDQQNGRQDIVVVGSLVDKVPNLAGLARTCEVLRANSFVIADRRVMKDHSFSSISVTAEQWVPVHEVPVVTLSMWLEGKKQEGYRLLGLEQTAESVSLPEFKFPKKCVLVLGREKEGIPADVLQILDHTVEIPQLGVIRSLNVHVSGAIALYEYTRQHGVCRN